MKLNSSEFKNHFNVIPISLIPNLLRRISLIYVVDFRLDYYIIIPIQVTRNAMLKSVISFYSKKRASSI